MTLRSENSNKKGYVMIYHWKIISWYSPQSNWRSIVSWVCNPTANGIIMIWCLGTPWYCFSWSLLIEQTKIQLAVDKNGNLKDHCANFSLVLFQASSREIQVFTTGSRKPLASSRTDGNGKFCVMLPLGEYIIKVHVVILYSKEHMLGTYGCWSEQVYLSMMYLMLGCPLYPMSSA